MDYENFINDLKTHERLQEISMETFIKKGGVADSLIDEMKKKNEEIKINQLRNFFNEINKIEKKSFTSMARARLEMSLAYDYGRNVINKKFYDLMSLSLERIKDSKDYSNFVEMVKALIAYHKYHSRS